MNRRTFLSSLGAGAAVALDRPPQLHADLPKMKIKRIRFYQNPRSRPMFNQSFHIVTVETDRALRASAKADRATPSPSAPEC